MYCIILYCDGLVSAMALLRVETILVHRSLFFPSFRKKLLEASINNPSNHEYEPNVDSVSIPEYDVINTLERHRFTNNYIGYGTVGPDLIPFNHMSIYY